MALKLYNWLLYNYTMVRDEIDNKMAVLLPYKSM